MEQKTEQKSGGLLKWVIIALIIWFAYDHLIAKHWQILYADQVNAGWILDSTSPKFKNQTECLSYAASLQTTGSGIFRYSCGYRCKTPSGDLYASCKDQV